MIIQIQDFSAPQNNAKEFKIQNSSQPVRWKTRPGMRLELSLDGVKQTGQTAPDSKQAQLKLQRKGADLLVLGAQDEALVEFQDFFQNAGVTLLGQEWRFVATSPEELANIQRTDTGIASWSDTLQALNTSSTLNDKPAQAGQEAGLPQAENESPNPITPSALPVLVAPLGNLAPILGGTAIAASLANGTNPPAPSAPITLTGHFLGGPAIANNGLTITLYDLTGQQLGTAKVQDDGSYSVNIGSYTGGVVAKITDKNGDAPDFIDEATGQAKSINAIYMAALVVSATSGNTTISINVNAATTIAAVRAGFSAVDGNASGTVTEAKIQEANTAVAKIAGLSGSLTETAAVATINVDGSANASANGLGKFLAALSGVDKANGGDMAATVTTLSTAITGSGPRPRSAKRRNRASCLVRHRQASKSQTSSPCSILRAQPLRRSSI